MSAPAAKQQSRVEKTTYSTVKGEPYLVVKTVVGEVAPLVQHAYDLRKQCFTTGCLPPSCAGTARSPANASSGTATAPPTCFRENADAVALHVVAYLNLTALEAYMVQHAELTKARAGVGLSTLRFRGQLPDPPPVYIEEATKALAQQRTSAPAKAAAPSKGSTTVPAHIAAAVADGALLTRAPTPTTDNTIASTRYVPPKLHPIGALRLRRVSRCPHLGRFHMMIATVEWQCVLREYRHTGVGAALLHMAERAAREAFHVPYVFVFTPPTTRAFYENQGYATQLVPPRDAQAKEGDTVEPCLSNTAACLAAGYTPRAIDVNGVVFLVMGKSLVEVKETDRTEAAKSNL